jgi:hypothetical protein
MFQHLSHAHHSPRHHDIAITVAGCFSVSIESYTKARTRDDPSDILVDLIADLFPFSASELRMEDNALIPKTLLPRA